VGGNCAGYGVMPKYRAVTGSYGQRRSLSGVVPTGGRTLVSCCSHNKN
jgi:hypothetical protein